MALTLADFLADVAAVYTGSATEGAFGSGRLIAPGLVLTAGHVVDYPSRAAPSRTGWRVRLLRERAQDGAWTAAPHEGELLWRGPGELDLALLRIREDVAPLLKPVITSYDDLETIDAVDAAGFPEAWYDTAGTLRDYRVRGSLRLAAQAGPYAWSVPPADKPDDPKGWRGMSGAAVCYGGREDKLYLFGAVQQVPANFSGGLLEVARISDGMADSEFSSFVGAALREQPPVVRWAADSSYGFSRAELNELLEKLRGSEAIPASWAERQEKLAARAAVSEQALATIARRLGVEDIPAGELGAALIDRIDRLHLAENQVQALPGDNPMKPLAAAAAGRGEYDRAERLLAVAQEQIRAIQLLDEGNPDLAIATLQEAVRHLGEVPAESPIDDRIAQGYLYKTLEQAFSAKGDQAQADQYLAKALAVFQGLARDTLPEGDTVQQFAAIMNGMGNLRAARGQHKEAIREYRVATALAPGYAYSWHDTFLSYYALAKQGEVHLTEMREALDNAKQTGKGWRGLEGSYFERLDRMLAEFDMPKKGRNPRKKR